MKILFVASNPDGHPTLVLEREITYIQQRLASILPSLAPLEFRPLPHIEPDELFEELRNRPPDILHLSVHAASDGVDMSAAGVPLLVTGDRLAKLLGALPVRPRLVYLNACDSASIASKLADAAVEFAVGTEVPLTNRNAIKSVVTFYDWLARGHSIQSALEAAKAVLDVLAGEADSISLYHRNGARPERTQLRALPMIVARLPKRQSGRHKGRLQLNRKKDGYYNVQFGILNCPADTIQVVMFVTDALFITDENSLADDLCAIEREQPWPPEVWFDEQWDTSADYRVFATGVRAGGDTFTISSSPSEALTAALEKSTGGKLRRAERLRIAEIATELKGVPR